MIGEHKSRICIYCYYNENGRITKDVIIFCGELRKMVDYLVVVVNGRLVTDSLSDFHADEIVFRDNHGLDAGAYKEVLFDEKYKKIIEQSSELILCNNSFFGPFTGLSFIFDKMENSKADFWGLSASEFELTKHIQSYFLLFRKNILESEVFWNYFRDHIDEYEEDYFMVCAAFENGLYHELVSHSFIGDAYVKRIRCETYRNPLGSILLDELPILKKKVFSSEFLTESAWSTVYEIDRIYDYPISIICDVAKELYGVIGPKEIGDVESKVKYDLNECKELINREDVQQFINAHELIFIYGTGFYAHYVFSAFFYYRSHAKLKGFFVSRLQNGTECCGYPVFQYQAAIPIENAGIIVAVSKKNTGEILENLNGVGGVLSLWKDYNDLSKNQYCNANL